jgi:hypothetical protein
MNFQMCYLLGKSLETHGILTTKEIDSVATNSPRLKPGQGVLPSGLKIFSYNLGDMHNLTFNIRGDTTLQS